jgi:arylsulfatase
VKGRYKRHWVGEKPGLSGAGFFDLYTDAREENGKLVSMLSAKGMFDMMRTRHGLWMQKYPNTAEARDFPFTGLENPRPATLAASRPRVDPSKLPFDPAEAVRLVPGWAGTTFDTAD